MDMTMSSRSSSSSSSTIQFGFLSYPTGHNAKVDLDGRSAWRAIPQNDDYAGGIVYGHPLSGRSKFEVELLGSSYRFGTFKIGIAGHAAGRPYYIPSIAETAESHLVWLGDGVYGDTDFIPCKARRYSTIDLHDLRPGCRVGFNITSDGTLRFSVNGYNQGVAARNVYKQGLVIRPVVDLFGGCHVRITLALTKMGVNHVSLQDRCLEVISESLVASSAISTLPIPTWFQEQLKFYVPPSIPRLPSPPKQDHSRRKKWLKIFFRRR